MKLVSLQIPRALSVRIIIFGNVVPCGLSDRYQCPTRMWWHVVCRYQCFIPVGWLVVCQMRTNVPLECDAV
jgi:hypothetical protein